MANTVLTELNLGGNGIGVAGATKISEALTANAVLTELNLAGNSIGAAGATKISKALASNPAITDLNVEDNEIRIGYDGTLALGKALRARSLPASRFTLKGVRLGDCWEALELPEASGRSLRRRTGTGISLRSNENVLAYLRIGMWSNEKVLAYFGELQAKRAIACAMVSHARLGHGLALTLTSSG